MPGRIFSRSFTQAILDSSREIRSLSDLYCHSLLGSEPPETLQLQLPEVRAPSQYLIDMGFKPTLAQQLSKTYMDFVARYRKSCQSNFDRATRGGGHLTEYYREVFVALFRRTTRAWGSHIVSIARVQLRQAGAPQATVRPECVDIRVDDATKVEIIARLGCKVTHLTSDRMLSSPGADVTSRLEEESGETHALSTFRVDSRLMLSELSPISPIEVTSRPFDPFCQPAPPTCFPAPYPPEQSLYHSTQRALATSFVPPAPPRNVRPFTSYSPDVSSLTDLFGRMTVTTSKTHSTNPNRHRMFGISEFNKVKPISSSITANCSAQPQLENIESIASPPSKSTTTVRRRKIAALPTRRGKISAPPSPPVFDSAGAAHYPIPRPYGPFVEVAPPDHISTSQKTRLAATLPPPHTAEVPCFVTPKSSTLRQRKVHTLRKTLTQTQPVPQHQTLKSLATAGETSYNVSRSPPLVSDATSYFDSPPTSSDELDTPPSTPPSSHVLLASTSTESLAISSESGRIVSHKEPLRRCQATLPEAAIQTSRFHERGSRQGRATAHLHF